MTRNAMWQVQKGREPLGLRRAVLFDVFPTVSTTNHRAHRNDEHIHQLVTAVGGIGASGIGQRGKIVLKRGRWEHTHKGPPLGTKGFWLQITRPPYRKTHSSFKCACPEFTRTFVQGLQPVRDDLDLFFASRDIER